MQTERTATARKEPAATRAGARRTTNPAAGPEKTSARRRVGIPGPGLRRVPSLVALKGAQRHSRIVRTMRVLLPSLALLVIGLVALQAFMYRADDTLKLKFASASSLADDLKMVAPEFSARFGADNPFKIEAKDAFREEGAPNRVIMNNPRGEVDVNGVSWFSVEALKGVLDTETARIVLGNVDLFSGLGYELHTESVNIDLDKGIVAGRSPVSGQGPLGTLQANSFMITDNGERILFKDKVRLTLKPAAPPSG